MKEVAVLRWLHIKCWRGKAPIRHSGPASEPFLPATYTIKSFPSAASSYVLRVRKEPIAMCLHKFMALRVAKPHVSAQIYSFHRRRVWFKVTELGMQLNLVFELSARCYFYYITWPLYETQLFCQGLAKWEGFGSEKTAPGELLHALGSHWGELHRTTQNVLVTLYSAGRLRGDLESPSPTSSRMMQMLQVQGLAVRNSTGSHSPRRLLNRKGYFQNIPQYCTL